MAEQNTLNTHKSLLLCCWACMLLSGCWKRIEHSGSQSIAGVVYDDVKRKRLPNVKIYLYAAREALNTIDYAVGPLDSTISDTEGKFLLQFEPSDDFFDYGLQVGRVAYGGIVYDEDASYVPDFRERIYRCNQRKNITDAVVKARELNFTKVRLTILANPFDSFYVRALTYGFRRPVLAVGKTIDTTLIIRHLPNELNVFQFYTESLRDTVGLAALNSNPANNARRYTIRRMVEDSLLVDLQDTFRISKRIANTLDMPRQ